MWKRAPQDWRRKKTTQFFLPCMGNMHGESADDERPNSEVIMAHSQWRWWSYLPNSGPLLSSRPQTRLAEWERGLKKPSVETASLVAGPSGPRPFFHYFNIFVHAKELSAFPGDGNRSFSRFVGWLRAGVRTTAPPPSTTNSVPTPDDMLDRSHPHPPFPLAPPPMIMIRSIDLRPLLLFPSASPAAAAPPPPLPLLAPSLFLCVWSLGPEAARTGRILWPRQAPVLTRQGFTPLQVCGASDWHPFGWSSTANPNRPPPTWTPPLQFELPTLSSQMFSVAYLLRRPHSWPARPTALTIPAPSLPSVRPPSSSLRRAPPPPPPPSSSAFVLSRNQ
ncbi:hypothetical protein Mp_2g11900 [Marchantia polymorpha subsp. ruderalis]|uniref:Uncharacterized protein n=1 Tax=Marchantia polymorpha TaxID=3197 RepID=A0A2R6XCM4_MARPO|nr:hypothetical protein MARPO_0023s0155 [Marchantia polymorpha]BBN01999.1 hypothetical protein Mp_2g11900 [Marchantia polymorpha subsp. ruderalis]|eukprot:PTQ43861.1 hypothetical protein MARPO_0023s0155 [Marchantia polymorpha]